MPLTRSELIARSLIHANKMTAGTVPLPALIDHNHFNHLSPEEKADVIDQYSRQAVLQNIDTAPGILTTIGSGIKNGLISSIIPAIASTALTMPTLAALQASRGNPVAMKDILRRTLVPVGVIAGIGAGVGVASEFMQRGVNSSNNAYLQKILKSVNDEPDSEQRRVKAMALVAAAPYLNRKMQASENIAPAVRTNLLERYLDPSVAPEMMKEFMGNDTYHKDGGKITKTEYNDWRMLRGVGPIMEETKGKHYYIKDITDEIGDKD